MRKPYLSPRKMTVTWGREKRKAKNLKGVGCGGGGGGGQAALSSSLEDSGILPRKKNNANFEYWKLATRRDRRQIQRELLFYCLSFFDICTFVYPKLQFSADVGILLHEFVFDIAITCWTLINIDHVFINDWKTFIGIAWNWIFHDILLVDDF